MSTVGALQNYYSDSTRCYDRCGYFNTSKQDRLGFDNVKCLINCNDFYSKLKNKGLMTVPVTYERGYLQFIPKEYIPQITNMRDLKKLNLNYNINQCVHQCDLDKPFMSNSNNNMCKRKCNIYTVNKMGPFY